MLIMMLFRISLQSLPKSFIKANVNRKSARRSRSEDERGKTHTAVTCVSASGLVLTLRIRGIKDVPEYT